MSARPIRSSPPAPEAPRPFRISVDAYYRMVDVGIIPPDARVELIEGEVIEMPPMGPPHDVALQLLLQIFAALASEGRLRIQMPLGLSEYSEPEPDLLVVAPGTPVGKPNVEQVALAVEIAYASRKFDLQRKAPLYRRTGILETWVLDIPHQRLVVFPRDGGSVVHARGQGSRITPRAVPEVTLDLDELFAALPKS